MATAASGAFAQGLVGVPQIALLVPGGAVFWLVVSGVVFGLGLGSAFPVFSAYVMQHVPTSRRGAAFGGMLAAFEIWQRVFIDPPAIQEPDATLSDYRAD